MPDCRLPRNAGALSAKASRPLCKAKLDRPSTGASVTGARTLPPDWMKPAPGWALDDEAHGHGQPSCSQLVSMISNTLIVDENRFYRQKYGPHFV
tara:strand:+ start:123554 stop:123838 length:285 start_codon:yes stop_codon:yes gene_type:complete